MDQANKKPTQHARPISRLTVLEQLISKIERCIDYQNLYALESDFNQCGLTVQCTSRNRMVLAKLRDGKPVTEQVINDYIFIGGLDNPTAELSTRAVNTICDFVRTNYGTPGAVSNVARVWRNGLKMYGQSLVIANEDVNEVADKLINE